MQLIYELQLAAIYIWGTSSSEMSWHCVGYGLRLAQTLGFHRKKAYHTKPTVEEELRKRAFWYVLLVRSELLDLNLV